MPLSCRRSPPALVVTTVTNDPSPPAYLSSSSPSSPVHYRPHHLHRHFLSHRRHWTRRRRTRSREHSVYLSDSPSAPSSDSVCEHSFDPKVIHVFGCYDSIASWIQRAADVLSVLGFCVITFLKVCFTFILRYEIREMIQKIQVLKRSSSSIPCPSGHQSSEPMRDNTAKNEDKT